MRHLFAAVNVRFPQDATSGDDTTLIKPFGSSNLSVLGVFGDIPWRILPHNGCGIWVHQCRPSNMVTRLTVALSRQAVCFSFCPATHWCAGFIVELIQNSAKKQNQKLHTVKAVKWAKCWRRTGYVDYNVVLIEILNLHVMHYCVSGPMCSLQNELNSLLLWLLFVPRRRKRTVNRWCRIAVCLCFPLESIIDALNSLFRDRRWTSGFDPTFVTSSLPPVLFTPALPAPDLGDRLMEGEFGPSHQRDNCHLFCR